MTKNGYFVSFVLLCCVTLLASCGGGGGGDNSLSWPLSQPRIVSPSGSNVATVIVDGGPIDPATNQQVQGDYNLAFVTVKLCIPGTSTCTQIDHVQVDTGSVGLRIMANAISDPTFIAALPASKDVNGVALGECYSYISSYMWGSAKQADFTVAGESVSAMPLQIVGDPSVSSTPPSDCAAQGLQETNTVGAVGANGVLGIGTTRWDCGSTCVQGGATAAEYYACSSATATCTQTSVALSAQLPNPVAAFAVDNNGSSLTLNEAPPMGQTIGSGYLVFGIGTQSNNGLNGANVIPVATSTAYFTTQYGGYSLTQSYVDSGTGDLDFGDSHIAQCSNNPGFYCPSSLLGLNANNIGQNGASVGTSFAVGNADQMSDADTALPTLAQYQDPSNDSFAWGLPFFYSRTVYTALEGATTPGGAGPYVAY